MAERLAEVNNRPTGFDYLRLTLSAAVVVTHSSIICYGGVAYLQMFGSPLGALPRLILPMFFALSGFLVAGSLERSKSVVGFLGLRLIRIYPALVVESALSAFLIGAVLTTVPLGVYFTSPVFFSYLLNTLGDPHFHLPGLFLANPDPGIVNAQLWTVPYELLCYAAIALLALIGIRRLRALGPLGAAGLTVFWGLQHVLKGQAIYAASFVHGPLLVVSFLWGVSFYLYRDRLPWSRKWAVGAGALLAACSFASPYLSVGWAVLLLPLFATYLTVWLGLTNAAKLGVIRGADYSYGIFLYGFVIQQAVCFLAPWSRHWWLNLVIALPLSAAFAAFSWHVVEKPALKLRARVVQVETAWLALRGATKAK